MIRDIAEIVLIGTLLARVVGDALAVTFLAGRAPDGETPRYTGATLSPEPAFDWAGLSGVQYLVHAAVLVVVVATVLQPQIVLAVAYRPGLQVTDVLLVANVVAGYGLAGVAFADGLDAWVGA